MSASLNRYYSALLAAGRRHHPSIDEAREDSERAQRRSRAAFGG